ncbi:efflux RND transporter periplasmic adaptor subunit [Thermus thermamylovorans]|uniref:Efflux RND transporter periplasmic adaptor subunit n=1 Tax=Thermus thermamylovorans TaxID=2509362 RepID=A0A4V2IV42_9DEIN|nr:efflux RND transporter periplasmic adaptor subunit [Thermus thermamylovorans]TBH20804.1 efflux RND transporter periplasmic adaptor subunit [Thermus thermamylovorans]
MRRGWVLLGALLLAGAFWAFRPRPEPPREEPPQVVRAVRGEVRATVLASGTLEAWRVQEVYPAVSGTLAWIAAEGQGVAAGEPLARLDPEPFRRRVAEAEAAWARAEASLALARVQGEGGLASLRAALRGAELARAEAEEALEAARRHLEGARTVYAAGGLSRQALLEAEEAHRRAERALLRAEEDLRAQREALAQREAQLREELRGQEAALAQARLALEEARAALEAATLRAPFPGTVLRVAASPGAQVGPGTPLLALGEGEAFRLVLEVDETEVARVRPGQRVRATFEAFPGQAFLGEVAAVSPRGELVSNIPVFRVSVRLPPDPRLRPGMTGDGEIVVEEARDVLVLPRRAVERARGQAFVTVLRPDGSTERVPVRLGLEGPTQVAVLEGLAEGDQVLLPQRPAGSRPAGSGGGVRLPLPGVGR